LHERLGEWGDSIFPAFAVAQADFTARKVDVFDSERAALGYS
jgi:hypothetical protein